MAMDEGGKQECVVQKPKEEIFQEGSMVICAKSC